MWWEDMAHSRDRWKQFTDEVFHIKGILKDRFYADLHHVDLCGRCLLRTGDRFWLLPQTHPPIDPPYPSSFQHVPHTEEATEAACFCVACDGSRKGVHLGLGVAILPPYGSFPQDVVVSVSEEGAALPPIFVQSCWQPLRPWRCACKFWRSFQGFRSCC